jgi:hypothetical protein
MSRGDKFLTPKKVKKARCYRLANVIELDLT